MKDELRLHFITDNDVRNAERARMQGGSPSSDRRVSHASIGDLLRTQAAAHADAPWLVFHPDQGPRMEWTYAAFLRRVEATADILRALGVRRGHRICTISHNHADTVVHYFAAWMIGAAVVPINTGEDGARISWILANAGARVAFVRTAYLEHIEAYIHDIPEPPVIIETGETPTGRHRSYDQLLSTALRTTEHPPSGRAATASGAAGQSSETRAEAEHAHTGKPEAAGGTANDEVVMNNPAPSEVCAEDEPSLDDDALIVYTSGTTGHPKGVVLDQYNLLVDARAIAEWHGVDAAQRVMCVLPIHHVNGTVVTLLAPLVAGASVVLLQKFHTRGFFELIAQERVHVVSVVPTLLQFLLHEFREDDPPPHPTLRHVICGAGPLTCDLAQRFEHRFDIPIVHGYGLSETTCYSCFLPADLSRSEHEHWMQAFGFPSIGVALPINDMDIQNADGHSLPEGERGEIVVRGHNVMRYYHRNPEANASAFAHGWFRSGDEGFFRVDARGWRYFFITGRIKELIIRGGVNIAPLEIDEVISGCPGVKAGIAVGFENAWYGEEVGALVVRDDPALTAETVLAHCRATLPFSKAPKVVVFADDIPVTSTGKYQRGRVRHLFSAYADIQFQHP